MLVEAAVSGVPAEVVVHREALGAFVGVERPAAVGVGPHVVYHVVVDARAVARPERVHAAHVAHDPLAEVVDPVVGDLVALRHRAREAPRPAHRHARVVEVVDVAVQHLGVRDVRVGYASSLGVEQPAVADHAVLDAVERRRARREVLDDAAHELLAICDMSGARAHPHAARAQVEQLAVRDRVGDAPVVEAHAVVARVRERAAVERDAPHALRRHGAVIAASGLVLIGLRGTAPAVGRRPVRVGERDSLEDDVVHVRALVGIAPELHEAADLGGRRHDLRARHVLARQRTVEDRARLRVVEPFARRVERGAHVLEAHQRLARVPYLPSGPWDAAMRLDRHRRRIDAAQDAAREAPLVHHEHLRVLQLVGGNRRQRLSRLVRQRHLLNHVFLGRDALLRVRHLATRLRHVEILGLEVARAPVRQSCPVGPPAVHPQLLEVRRSAVWRARNGRGPHAAAQVLPACQLLAAREHGLFAFADPGDRSLARARICRREHKRLPESVDAVLHADRPCARVACSLRRAHLRESLVRRQPARRHRQFAAQRTKRRQGDQSSAPFHFT